MIRLLMLISAVFGIGYGYAITHDVWPFEGMDANQRGSFGDSWGAFTSIFLLLWGFLVGIFIGR